MCKIMVSYELSDFRKGFSLQLIIDVLFVCVFTLNFNHIDVNSPFRMGWGKKMLYLSTK